MVNISTGPNDEPRRPASPDDRGNPDDRRAPAPEPEGNPDDRSL
ncbi:hypothetical protein [Sphingomonas lutea]|nr:hypothetical protein [Sphingomonas lutea]